MAALNFGVRQWVSLVVLLINFYLRHKDNIDDLVEPAVAGYMQGLADAIDEIQALNPRGPR